MADTPPPTEPQKEEYLGNIFGWKISLIGAAVMLLIGAFVAYQHFVNKKALGFEDPLKGKEEQYAPGSSVPADQSDSLDLQQ